MENVPQKLVFSFREGEDIDQGTEMDTSKVLIFDLDIEISLLMLIL